MTYKYRTIVQSLIDEYERKTPAARVSLRLLADYIGVSRGTLNTWKRADSDNPADWLDGYDPDTAMKFRASFEKLLERKIDHIITPMRFETNSGTNVAEKWIPVNENHEVNDLSNDT